ncbi:DUF5666 domain-containing protein [Candidatus Frankia alpina]|uniref:DUF5666 domain-containing protein n=1 Tax=Candidatus Frankia alpina TaxID=2699483 RepID=UPI0013874971|nr:DUF5666 domain-containing protein [Candidatus Frankia alpina]
MTTANPVDPVRPGEPRRRRRALAAGPILGVALAMSVAVSACGGGGSGGSTATAAAASAPSQAAGSGQGRGQAARPGTTGTIAAVTATNIEVQNPASGQVTVTWTPNTTFVKTTSASAIAVGDCVTVIGGSPGTTFTAQSVTVSQPVSGSCTAGFGRGFGGAGGFPGGARPSDRPTARSTARSTARPNAQGLPNGGRFAAVTGAVTKVAGTTITVQGPQRPGVGASASAAPAATAAPGATVTSTVTLGSSTTVEKTSSATSAALTVGECLTAVGKADDTGAVAATSISVRPAAKEGCAGGFGGRGFGGQGSGRRGSGGRGSGGGTANG